MPISYFWSREFLMNRKFLWLLFWVNLLGTIYGYIWYGNQLELTLEENPLWQIVFVPDSPTASLFFTLSLLYMLYPPTSESRLVSVIRQLIEGLAIVCSVKYGIWAVAMIVAGGWQGSEIVWEHYMLSVSHLGMALEVLLYARFMKAEPWAVTIGAAWLFINDTVDYTYGVFPWLAEPLYDDLPAIRNFTYGLSLFSFVAALVSVRLRKKE
ncbi:DUF1405 domain-containing protein [Paenibacillus thailandensis]|uniref:DUF1405 domain-containing protein n=1 Tax=Paenibacillus thailandensis TaxID=393250 RepID=A0ABW5R272_9BACL